MTLISRLTAAAFAVVVALLVVFAAAPAEGQSIRVTPDVVRGSRVGEQVTVKVEVSGLPTDMRSVHISADGEFDEEFTRGIITKNRIGCRAQFALTRPVPLRGGAGTQEYTVSIGFFNRLCSVKIADHDARTPLTILGERSLNVDIPFRTSAGDEHYQMIADGDTKYELDVRTLGFEGHVGVELHPQRSHPRCRLGASLTRALFQGAPDPKSNLYRKWRFFVPARITKGDIAPATSVECVLYAGDASSGASQTFAYHTLHFHAVDGPPTPPPPPPVDRNDKRTLQTLFNETGGRNWTNSRNWNTDRPLSEWYGVETIELVGIGTAVSVIRLPNNNLTGEIPRELNDLGSFFDTLVLNGNRLTGDIPRELARFENTINPQQGGVNLCVEGRSGCGDPPPPDDLRIALSAARTTLTEGEETTLTARANRAVTEDVTLLIRMTGGTAGESDIERTNLLITSGSREASTYLRAVSDNLTEGTETATLTAYGYPDETRYGSVTITIRDDTPPPPTGDLEISLSGPDDMNITEGMSVMVTARANRAVTENTMVDLVLTGGSASPDDYTAENPMIMAGQMTGEVMLTAVDDMSDERMETMTIEGRFVDGVHVVETNALTFNIWDRGITPPPPPDDLNIMLSEYNDTYDITEGEVPTLYATADRIVAEDVEITLHRVGGRAVSSDIRGLENGILIEAGNDSGYGSFTAIEDGIYEAQETLVLEGRFGNGRTTNILTFNIWDRSVPALPFLGALLLAAGLCVMGLRKVRGRRG